MDRLIGLGLYTAAEAGRLLNVRPATIRRWLQGYIAKGVEYAPLWETAIDSDDLQVVLSFDDLMEVRVADAFIRYGVPSTRIRAAIVAAKEALGQNYPLSTDRFRTDGREIFLKLVETDGEGLERERLLNLFRRQYEFSGVLDPILKTVDFMANGRPELWWPRGRRFNVVVDPSRSFGQPIDAVSSVPTSILAAAARNEGVLRAALAYDVDPSSVRRAVEFEAALDELQAA